MKNELQKIPLRIEIFEAQAWAVEIAQRPAPARPLRVHVRKTGFVPAPDSRSTRSRR